MARGEVGPVELKFVTVERKHRAIDMITAVIALPREFA
jgi:hypothetical protein